MVTFEELSKEQQIKIIGEKIVNQKELCMKLENLNQIIVDLIYRSKLDEKLKTIIIDELNIKTNNTSNKKTR